MGNKENFEFYTDEQVNTLQTYIEEHYTLDGTAKHLVRNILEYVAAQGDDEENILYMLTNLLDGIGITEDEIVNAVVSGNEFSAVFETEGVPDIDIAKISGCSHSHSMTWCEANCPKYHDCHTIAIANDMLVAYEEQQDTNL